jgi:class 3 adenylate cyclase
MDARTLFSRLRRRTPANAAALDREIERRAGVEAAILVGDSSGFSRKTHEHGILQFLAVMLRCYDRMVPILRRRRGKVLTARADNLLAVFADPVDAVAGAVEVQRWLRSYNRGRRPAERFHYCFGVDVGRVLRLEDDVYGAAVNVASKLGEDLASKDEILVTGEVARRIKGRFRCAYLRSAEVGGRLFELHRVRG